MTTHSSAVISWRKHHTYPLSSSVRVLSISSCHSKLSQNVKRRSWISNGSKPKGRSRNADLTLNLMRASARNLVQLQMASTFVVSSKNFSTVNIGFHPTVWSLPHPPPVFRGPSSCGWNCFHHAERKRRMWRSLPQETVPALQHFPWIYCKNKLNCIYRKNKSLKNRLVNNTQ